MTYPGIPGAQPAYAMPIGPPKSPGAVKGLCITAMVVGVVFAIAAVDVIDPASSSDPELADLIITAYPQYAGLVQTLAYGTLAFALATLVSALGFLNRKRWGAYALVGASAGWALFGIVEVAAVAGVEAPVGGVAWSAMPAATGSASDWILDLVGRVCMVWWASSVVLSAKSKRFLAGEVEPIAVVVAGPVPPGYAASPPGLAQPLGYAAAPPPGYARPPGEHGGAQAYGGVPRPDLEQATQGNQAGVQADRSAVPPLYATPPGKEPVDLPPPPTAGPRLPLPRSGTASQRRHQKRGWRARRRP